MSGAVTVPVSNDNLKMRQQLQSDKKILVSCMDFLIFQANKLFHVVFYTSAEY